MVCCALLTCQSRSTAEASRNAKITYHRFPQDEARYKYWVDFVGREDWQPTKHSVICSKHFKPEYFDRTCPLIARLKREAVPTLFQIHSSITKKQQFLYCQLCSAETVKIKIDHIRGEIKNMLTIVAPQWNMSIYENAPACQECIATLIDLYNQKMIWLTNEKSIAACVNQMREKSNTKFVLGLKDHMMCRLCLRTPSSSDETVRCDQINDKLRNAVPEVDTAMSSDPIICKACVEKVDLILTFLGCFDTQDTTNIEEYLKEFSDNTNVTTIKQEVPDNTYENRCSPIIEIKQEEDDEITVEEIVLQSLPESNMDYNNSQSAAPDFMDGIDVPKEDYVSVTYGCSLCSFTAEDIQTYKNHIVSHHNSVSSNANYRPYLVYTCHICSMYSTKLKRNLKRHIRLRHDSEFNEVCSVCGCKFKNLRALEMHLIKLHDIHPNRLL